MSSITKKFIKIGFLILFIFMIILFLTMCLSTWCPVDKNDNLEEITYYQSYSLNEEATQEDYLNSVKGHIENTSIIGNLQV